VTAPFSFFFRLFVLSNRVDERACRPAGVVFEILALPELVCTLREPSNEKVMVPV